MRKRTEVLGGWNLKSACSTPRLSSADGVRDATHAALAPRIGPTAARRCPLYAYGSWHVVERALQPEPLLPRGPPGMVPRSRTSAAAAISARRGDDGRAWRKDEHVPRISYRGRRAPVPTKRTSPDRRSRRVAAPAGCSWARSRTCGRTSSTACCRRVPFVDCVTRCSTSRCRSPGRRVRGVGQSQGGREVRGMRAYSPYDNLGREGLPAILVNEPGNDSRRWATGSRPKYVAKLRTKKTDDAAAAVQVQHGRWSRRCQRALRRRCARSPSTTRILTRSVWPGRSQKS